MLSHAHNKKEGTMKRVYACLQKENFCKIFEKLVINIFTL